MCMKEYSGAELECNDDLSSQLGFIIVLCDYAWVAHVLDYSSKKYRHVLRQIMGAEVYAFADEL